MMALSPFSFTHKVKFSLYAGNLNLVNSFSVMLGWVEPALSKKWLCLQV